MKIFLMRQVLLSLTAAVGFICVGACAASFDCKSAKTEVEKTVCVSAELSKLDEELANAYRDALLKHSNKALFQQSQRLWLKQRGPRCSSDEKCLLRLYGERLTAIQGGTAANSLEMPAVSLTAYPDVWDWVAPKGRVLNGAILGKDGRVWISYNLRKDAFTSKPGEYVEFFSRRRFTGRGVPPELIETGNGDITLPSGAIFGSMNLRGMRSGKCFDGLNGVVGKRASGSNPAEWKVLLFLFDKPQRHVVPENCLGMDGSDFIYRVESVFPDLLPLKDNTFLVVDSDHGVIIRLDENWNTKSALLNKKIFIWDAEELRSSAHELHDDDLQEWHDRILERLLNTAKGKK